MNDIERKKGRECMVLNGLFLTIKPPIKERYTSNIGFFMVIVKEYFLNK